MTLKGIHINYYNTLLRDDNEITTKGNRVSSPSPVAEGASLPPSASIKQ